ncbi:MAG: glycosyltransferase family 4 protein [Planctomycetota bacterium]
MRVAFVYPDLSRKGGAENVVVWSAAGLGSRGHEVALLTGAFDPRLWPEGPALEGTVRPLPEGAGAFTGFDVVHPHNREALLATRGCGLPRLWFCHEPWRRLHLTATDAELLAAVPSKKVEPHHPAVDQVRRWRRRQTRWPWRRAAHRRALARERREVSRLEGVLVQSHYNARSFEKAFRRRPAVIDLGVPDPRVPGPAAGEPPAVRRGIAVNAGGNPKKNLYGVLAAARELERGGALAEERFEIWGAGSDAAAFQDLLRAWDLGSRVRLHGFLPDARARELLQTARLCLFLPLCEPFGLVAVEALLLETPLLASDHGGPAEIVGRTGGGWSVDPLRTATVAGALERLLRNDAALRRRGKLGAVRARSLFGMQDFLVRLEQRLEACARG